MHPVWTEVDNILVILLVLAQRVIIVHILHVGDVGTRGGIVFRTLGIGGGITFRVVVIFVTFQNLQIVRIVVAAAEVVVVVGRGIV